MANLFDYAEKFGDIKFNEIGLTEADNAIFCRLAYCDFSKHAGKTLSEISRITDISEENSESKNTPAYLTKKLLLQIGKSKRFKDITVFKTSETVSEDLATAFYGVTFRIYDGLYYAAFRGTDEKIISFYEDAELAYKFPITSQTTALKYISESIENYGGRYYIGGHSKGGNLAIFAYLFLKDEEKEHIIRVYNNDGPGLPNEVAEIMFTPQANESVYNLLPEDSIVGRMLSPGGTNKIIKSEASGGAQHNIFTWILKGSEFEAAKRFSLLSEYMEDTLTESLETMNPEQLKSIVQKLFEIAKAAGIKTVDDISIKNYKGLITALTELYKLVNDDNSEIPDTVKVLISSFINSISIEKLLSYSLPDFEDALNTATKKFAENREKSETLKQFEKEEGARKKAEKEAKMQKEKAEQRNNEKQREKEEIKHKRLERDAKRKSRRENRQSERSGQRNRRNSARNENRKKRKDRRADKRNK